jgi:cation diffusion facilitator family transporter
VTIARFVPGLDWMHQADALAALVVAVIVVYISGQLGWRTIAALLDTAPRGMVEKVEQATNSVQGVVNVHAIRIRPSGAHWFIDLHVNMNGDITLKEAHAATEVIENRVQEIIPGADVTIHMEPVEGPPPPRRKSARSSK